MQTTVLQSLTCGQCIIVKYAYMFVVVCAILQNKNGMKNPIASQIFHSSAGTIQLVVGRRHQI